MRIAPLTMLVAFACASAAAAAADGSAMPIASGSYHCVAGSSRMMLTLGEMKVTGMRYVFTAPSGPATSGSYALVGKGYRWSGDIGAITNSQIVESGPDATPGDFYFTFRARPTSLPTSVACTHG